MGVGAKERRNEGSKMFYNDQNFVRYSCLCVLTLQTTVSVLAIRYTRKQTEGGEEPYIGTTLVLTAEIIKFLLCLVLLFVQKSGSFQQTFKVLSNEVFFKPNETFKLAIPSSLYSLQNNLVLLALSWLDAATFQVTYQLKILTTAFFSVLLLRKEIKFLQWLALLILMSGIILVQVPTTGPRVPQTAGITSHHVVGLVAVLVSSISSGFAGVYYEKLLKESAQPSVVLRNIQLGLFSLLFGVAAVVFNDGSKVLHRGFLDGYDSVVWLVVILQASGGLLVAAVIKYADNILKGFATSISIILSCLFSYVVFHDLELEFNFLLGTGFVIAATFLYGIQSHSHSTTPTTMLTNSSETKKGMGLKSSNERLPLKVWNPV